MIDLPTELFRKIFDFLPHEDHVTCMSTCRRWKSVIEEFCLLRKVELYDYSFLEKIVNQLQQYPSLGTNVQQLTAQSYSINLADLIDLLTILPNLREISLACPTYESPIADDNNDLKFPWHHKIEFFEEQDDKLILSHLLSTNLCPNLTFISVSDLHNEIIPFLMNAPALITLALEGNYIEISDINKIHENVPYLKTLKLKNKRIYDDGFDSTTTPANLLIELVLINIDIESLETELRLLQFITSKYPNLEVFVHESNYKPGYNEEEDGSIQAGWDSLLMTLGPRLKKLYTNHTHQFQNLLPTLDEYNCQIHDLKIDALLQRSFPNFALSRQSLYIQTLILSRISFNSTEWLKELGVLKDLHILDPSLHLDFNDLLNNTPPTLTSLLFDDTILTADSICTRPCNIKRLSISDSNLSENIIESIHQYLPLLADLELINCKNLPKVLIFTSARLNSFHFIDATGNRNAVSMLVKTVNPDSERYYFINDEKQYMRNWTTYQEWDESDHPHVKSRPREDMAVETKHSLWCYSVKKILLSNYTTYRI